MAKVEYSEPSSKTVNDMMSFSEARKVEELKLGKFVKCEPLRLPEKKVRRGWQIAGGIGMILVALALTFVVFLLKPVRTLTWQPDGFGAFEGLPVYWLVMIGCMILAAADCLLIGILLLFGRRISTILWYGLIILATVGLLCLSFNSFEWFEERLCYENYPGIFPDDPAKGSGCPGVESDLIIISIRNMVIYTVGLVAILLVHRLAKWRISCATQPKR